MGDNLIVIKELSKRYGEIEVLHNINLAMKAGTIVGFVGRNGSGKTMLMKHICGLVHPSEGEIWICGKKLEKRGEISDNIGAIIENPGFLPEYSGFQNLKLLAMIQRKITDEKIREILKLVGLENVGKKHVGKYSLGMKQRLGIAQAIMENPDILILDEPMNGLDNEGVEEVRTLLISLKEKGKLIIIASHTREDIEFLCDEVYRMEKGKIEKFVLN